MSNATSMMSAETVMDNTNTNTNINTTQPEEQAKHKHKRRPGRSSRRRKRKAQAILEAAAASLSSSSSRAAADAGGRGFDDDFHDVGAATAGAATAAVPSDRGYTLEGVKVRRREERMRRLQKQNVTHDDHDEHIDDHDDDGGNDNGDGNGSANTHKMKDEEDAMLDQRDERALRSQLGFIPGNAVCVAARLPRELDLSINNGSPLSDSNDQEKERGEEDVPSKTNSIHDFMAPPSVLKNYPIAVRESYKGGKSEGRAFKGRRRGAMRVEGKRDEEGEGVKRKAKSQTIEDVKPDNCNVDASANSKSDKRERSWVVDSSLSAQPPNEQDASSNNQESNAQQQQQQPSKQIIEPFPTLYWLTSPLLRTQISKIEISKEHSVPQMEQRLRSNPEYLEQMKRAHRSYGQCRWELLTSGDQENILQRGWKAALDDSRGVAGIRLKNGRYDCVKCLHAHSAHFLAQVSEWVEEQTERKEEGGGEEEGNKRADLVDLWKECDRDDLNLVGKWTMEVVFEAITRSKTDMISGR